MKDTEMDCKVKLCPDVGCLCERMKWHLASFFFRGHPEIISVIYLQQGEQPETLSQSLEQRADKVKTLHTLCVPGHAKKFFVPFTCTLDIIEKVLASYYVK